MPPVEKVGLTERETSHPYIRVTDMRPGTVSLADIRFVPVEALASVGIGTLAQLSQLAAFYDDFRGV
jgi:hypothetical protein